MNKYGGSRSNPRNKKRGGSPKAKHSTSRGGSKRRGASGRNESGGRRRTQRGTTPVRRPETAAGLSRKQGGLGGDQVEGRHAVRELLLAGTRRTRELIFSADLDPAPILDEIFELARQNKVPIRELSRSKFDSTTRTEAAQGVMAYAQPIQAVELEELAAPYMGQPPFLLLLDGVTDPNNLGAILRVAECAGVTGIVLPRHRAARISASVTKAATGAVEHLRIAQVAGIPSAISRLAEFGVWTVALDMVADSTVFEMNVATDPVALVLGAEGSGVSRLARERCDTVARIPLAGSLGSLNVATASAVACYEVVRRRQTTSRS